MASPSTHPVPEKWVYSSAFIALDAALIGLAAVERLLLAKNEQATHAIVYHEGGFYLFNAADLLLHLLGSSEQARRRSNLRTLLDLQGSRQSPTVTEHEAPVPGSVVVRDGKAVGFVSMPDPAAGTLPALDFEHGVPVVVGAWPPLHRGYIDDIFKNRAENPGFDVRSSPTAASPVGGARVDGEEQPEDFSPAPTAPRFFNARTNNRVALNAQTYVIVQVAGEAAQPSFDSDASNVPFGDFIGSLTIDVYAPGLKADGPTTLTLQVPAGGDSAKVRFAFIAQKSGHQKIEVMAWNGSAQVAGVTLHVAVETDPVVAAPHEVTGDLKLREPEIGEYTLDVAMESDTRRYRFQLRSDQRDVWPPMYSESLLNARQHTYHTTIANVNAQARNLYGLKMEDQAIWLRGMGTLLFEQLVPDTLKALLIERKSKIRVLNILSEADPTPWELLFLADPETGDGEFLGASATVARWRYGAGPSRSLRRATKVLVLPDDAPPEAQANAELADTSWRRGHNRRPQQSQHLDDYWRLRPAALCCAQRQCAERTSRRIRAFRTQALGPDLHGRSAAKQVQSARSPGVYERLHDIGNH